jgi:CheY-like chemotaxis protein
MRILIVDASHAMRRVLMAILAHLGHVDVIETTNGLDAVKHLEANAVGLIIADWNMAKMDVGDFVRYVRMLAAGHQIPLLLIATITAGPYLGRSFPEDDAIDYVVKPFTVGTIEDKIVALMQK